MYGSALWTILLIIAIIFIIYAIFVSTNYSVQAWGNLILGILLVIFAVGAFSYAYKLFHTPQPVNML